MLFSQSKRCAHTHTHTLTKNDFCALAYVACKHFCSSCFSAVGRQGARISEAIRFYSGSNILRWWGLGFESFFPWSLGCLSVCAFRIWNFGRENHDIFVSNASTPSLEAVRILSCGAFEPELSCRFSIQIGQTCWARYELSIAARQWWSLHQSRQSTI